MQDRGIQVKHSSVYYPQANGQVERFNTVLKSFVQVAVLEQQPLRQAVTEYLGVYRCTPHATTARAPALLLHGRLPRTRLDVIGHPPVTFFDDLHLELRRLRERVKQKQQGSKRYTDARRAARETRVDVGDFVRVKKSSTRFKGDLEFIRPREVTSRNRQSSFHLDDGKTWNASKFSKLPRASTVPYTWRGNNTARGGGSPPTFEGPTTEITPRTSAAAPCAAQAHRSPAATQSAKYPKEVTQKRVKPPRKRLPPKRYGYDV